MADVVATVADGIATQDECFNMADVVANVADGIATGSMCLVVFILI